MKRIIVYISLISILVSLIAAVYLNAITLPIRIKAFVVDGIESATHKSVFIQSVRFSILKGLVLEGPVIYDDTSIIMRAKEASGAFLILPIFKKKVIIPSVKIESPFISIERKGDNSFNMKELIPKEYSEKGIDVTIYRIIVRNGHINLVDRALSPQFTKTIEKADIDIHLLLPAKVTFNLKCAVPLETHRMDIKSYGEYSFSKKELTAQVTADNLSLKEFAPYYAASKISFQDGDLDARVSLHFREGIVNADVDAATRRLLVSKDKLSARLDSNVKAHTRYDIGNKRLEYAGSLDIRAMDITGIDTIERLDNIKAMVEFSDSRISSDNLSVNALGLPWKARINLVNFSNPVFDIYASTRAHLSAFQKVLTEKFKMKFLVDIAGRSEIQLAIQVEPNKPPKLNGYIHMHDATISLGSGNFPIERINGQAQFTANTLTWSDVDIMYRGTGYKASGILTNFEYPGIQFEASSKDLSFKSIFAVDNTIVKLSQLKGKYLNSEFSVTGEVDIAEPDSMESNLKGRIEFDLKDLKAMSKPSDAVQKMKADGRLDTEFTLDGDIKNIGACDISAVIKSKRLLFYGFELNDMTFDYAQEEGVGNIKNLHSMFYGGLILASAKIDWLTKEPAYSMTLNAKDVKLERFKKDTDFKDKDVSGDIKMYASLNGFLKDPSLITGIGNMSITKGKLWQLNLFKGLGSLIFTSDFSDVIFANVSCDFKIKDKEFLTDDLILNSDLLKISGGGRIGFDKTVAASLRSEVAEESMYPGVRRNIATAIGKYTYIEVSGTTIEPKYKIRPSVSDIVDGVTSAFIQ
ncbi:MAG: DUF748 domain-containing protein [Candidatus Omnitrophota bacterium]|jgi:hypothetical protein